MWANRDWVGRYLPAETPVGRELAAYARICNAVEGNTTFYATPDPETVAKWRESVPEGFRFMFKLPRVVTHERRLRDCTAEVTSFVARMEPLVDRLGPFCVQLPASFGPESMGVLEQFMGALPSAFAWAVEVRHADFHFGGGAERPLNDLLHSVGANRVMLDSRALFSGPRVTSEEIETFGRKPRLPVRAVATGTQPVVRFIGRTDEEANAGFWEPWVMRVVRWIEAGLEPLVFLHTPDNAVAPALARRFHADVAAALPDLDPLPDPPEVTAPQQMFEP